MEDYLFVFPGWQKVRGAIAQMRKEQMACVSSKEYRQNDIQHVRNGEKEITGQHFPGTSLDH